MTRKGWNLAAAGKTTEVHLACGTWDGLLSWKDLQTRAELKTKVQTNVRPEWFGSKPTLANYSQAPAPFLTKQKTYSESGLQALLAGVKTGEKMSWQKLCTY